MAKPGHIYHWRHGWIPITPRAAMIKAKGSHSGAAKYMKHYDIPDRRAGGDRREGHPGIRPAGARAREDGTYRTPGEDRGTFEYRRGTRTKDYPDRAPGQRYGKPAPAAETPAAGGEGMSEREAFRKPSSELKKAAAGGDKGAQRELDRRAAKKGKPAGKPAAAEKPAPTPAPVVKKPLGEAGDEELAKEVYRRGGTVHDGEFKPGTASRTVRMGDRNPGLEHHGDQEIARELHQRGRNVDAEGQVTKGMNPEVARAIKEQEARRTSVGGNALADAKAAAAAEDKDIEKGIGALLPAIAGNHRVSAVVGRDFKGDGSPKVISSQHYDHAVSRYRAVGEVKPTADGKWSATLHAYTDKGNRSVANDEHIGTYDTRAEAHHLLALHHELAKAKAEDRKSAKGEAARKAADKAAEKRRALAGSIVGTAGPNGEKWTVHEVPNDGTSFSAANAAKVKQAYKAGNTTVLIEHDLDESQTKELLGSVTKAVSLASPNLPARGVEFKVPKGDKLFTPKKYVGGYVTYGSNVVHINPHWLTERPGQPGAIPSPKDPGALGKPRESIWDKYTAASNQGHFVPSAKSGDHITQTMLHEMGHVVDGEHRHSRPAWTEGTPTVKVGGMSGFRADNARWAASVARDGHSGYGRTNPAEGYAEAFAQWHAGGAGSHRVADQYAAKFGWKPPNARADASTSVGSTGQSYADAVAIPARPRRSA